MDSAKNQFIKHLEKSGRATATILAYSKDLDQLIEFLKELNITDLKNINSDHLKGFKEHLTQEKYTLKSISRKLNSIKSFFKYLSEQDMVEENPALQVSHPKYKIQPPRILSPLEYRALRDSAKNDSRIYAIIELLLQTGIRIGELASLQLEDIDLEKGSLAIRPYESHPDRRVPLNKTAQRAIEDYLKERPKTRTSTLFVTKTGNPFLIRNIRTSINRFFKIAGIENAKVNDLRHTFIVEQLKQGVPIVELSKISGHKRLSTTEKYLQFVQDSERPKKVKIAEL